jgi:uncharacterized protein
MPHSERTCIGCRCVRGKQELIRIVAGPEGILIDYREKLPGRAVYVCPLRTCISQALSKTVLARALRVNISAPDAAQFIAQLAGIIKGKIFSLLAIARKAGKTAGGYSAVRDAVEKNRVHLLLYAEDLSDGTKEKIVMQERNPLPEDTLFTRDEYGTLFNRELIGVVGILDEGLAHAVVQEVRRLKNLINSGN